LLSAYCSDMGQSEPAMSAGDLPQAPRTIRDALTPAERGDFDREYRQAMADATENLDLTPVVDLLERWRRVAVSAHDSPAHERMLEHARRLNGGERLPTEPWPATARRLGL
jgi:Family of unknown function (DUF6247)